MKRLWTLALLACLCPSAAFGQINSLPSQPHLLVRGRAEQVVTPDRFRITVELEQKDEAPDVARHRAQTDADMVLNLFKQQHALPETVHASSLSVGPSMHYVEGRQVFEGTAVRRTLTASFDKLQDVRAVLGGLKTSEQVQVSGIEPSYSEETRVRGELKRQAAQQTRVTAGNLANAYGVHLGGLYTISEVAPNFAYGIQAGSWGEAEQGIPVPPSPPAPLVSVSGAHTAGDSESLEAGDITLSENVYAVFLIAQ